MPPDRAWFCTGRWGSGKMQSCDCHGAAHDQDLDCCEFTVAATGPEECTLGAEESSSCSKLETTSAKEAEEQLPLNSAGLRMSRRLAFLPNFQNKAAQASPYRNSYQAFLLSREMLVKGCIKLAGVIRRTAVVCCFAPPTAGDQDDLPSYSQLDKGTRALQREAFGPLYLVT